MSADPHHTPGVGSVADLQAQAARVAREMGDNAHQVWLAGIGALSRAQSEGSRFFEQLAEEGRKPESVFDFVQGITAVARHKTHQDARLDMEGRAKKLLDGAA